MRLIIHADEDAQHIGLHLERVLLPTFLQFTHRVAGYAAIREIEIEPRKRRSVFRRDDENVAVTEDMIRICAATTIPVGDRVPLKKDARAC